jgi:hypothetical protein
MKRFKLLNVFMAMVLVATCQQSQAQVLDIINDGLGFAEDIVTADQCLSTPEKVRGAAVAKLPLVAGAAIGIPIALMSGSISQGLKWGGAVAGMTAAASASAGIVSKQKVEDAAKEPRSFERKLDFELCRIMADRRAQLKLVLENLQNQVSPPCIYVIAENQYFRQDVVRNGNSFLEQVDNCAVRYPDVLPYLQMTASRIAELNRATCLHASEAVQHYEYQMQNEAIQNGTSFVNRIQPLCNRQNDYQYFDFSQ